MKTLFGQLEEIAISRLQEFERSAIDRHSDGYYLAYSGGKDSDVILNLTRKSGVKFTAHYHNTTCDPPELVYHVREQADVEIVQPEMTMWTLVRKKGMPPRRNARYCCRVMKEGGGEGRIVITGVRWGESARRSKRKMLEPCMRGRGKHFLNVIIDWRTSDVWDYIRSEQIDYCKLYDEGFARLGCVMCPMSREVERDMNRWPRIAKAWERAIKATWKPDNRMDFTPEEYWQWWINRDATAKADDQPVLFE